MLDPRVRHIGAAHVPDDSCVPGLDEVVAAGAHPALGLAALDAARVDADTLHREHARGAAAAATDKLEVRVAEDGLELRALGPAHGPDLERAWDIVVVTLEQEGIALDVAGKHEVGAQIDAVLYRGLVERAGQYKTRSVCKIQRVVHELDSERSIFSERRVPNDKDSGWVAGQRNWSASLSYQWRQKRRNGQLQVVLLDEGRPGGSIKVDADAAVLREKVEEGTGAGTGFKKALEGLQWPHLGNHVFDALPGHGRLREELVKIGGALTRDQQSGGARFFDHRSARAIPFAGATALETECTFHVIVQSTARQALQRGHNFSKRE